MRTLVRSTILGLLLAATSAGSPAPGHEAEGLAAGRPFADVPRDHWAYEAVEELRRLGILRGYPPAAIRPVPSKEVAPRPKIEPREPGTQKAGRPRRPAFQRDKPSRKR